MKFSKAQEEKRRIKEELEAEVCNLVYDVLGFNRGYRNYAGSDAKETFEGIRAAIDKAFVQLKGEPRKVFVESEGDESSY